MRHPTPANVWLKFTGTRAQARDALKALGLGEMLRRNDADTADDVGTIYSHDVAIVFRPNLLTTRATYDPANGDELTPEVRSGPHLEIRAVSVRAIGRLRAKIINAGGLPSGIKIVPPPNTVRLA